jgi:YHS domain-containing protein
MNGRAVLLSSLVVAGGLTVGVLALVTGCQKEKPAASSSKQMEQMPADQHATMARPRSNTAPAQPMAMPAQTATAQPAAQTAAEQTNCPVMGGPIDKSIFVEYKGKKVYFCCNSCVAQFQKDPEKYLAKLPQFAQ